jgi:hypothetical protein
MSIICPNWLPGYTLAPVMDDHVKPNNFNSLFYCRCEIAHGKNQERKSPKAEFLNLHGQIDSGSHCLLFNKKTEKNLVMFHLLELFRAETKCKS